MDKSDQRLYSIKIPTCPIACGNDMVYDIVNENGVVVGAIVRHWKVDGKLLHYTFKIEFPENIDVITKALIMGASMLVVSFVWHLNA